MRKFGLFLASATFLCVMSATWVEGQPGGKGKGGFQFGNPAAAPLTLLNRDDVKKELDITDDQIEKLPAEVVVAISKVLSEKQFKRFKQIDLQQRGNNAFTDKAVQKQLKLSGEQVKNITGVIETANKESGELFKGGKGGFGGFSKENQEKLATIRKEAKEKVLEVLTKDQRAAYRDMIGEEFKFQQQGGFGGKGKDTPKKKDAE